MKKYNYFILLVISFAVPFITVSMIEGQMMYDNWKCGFIKCDIDKESEE